MTNDTKTITMPADLADNWLAALRSGGYKQGRCRLMTEELNGDKRYCCLGVLQMVADGAVELDLEFTYASRALYVPTKEWLRAHNVCFLGYRHDENGDRNLTLDCHIPHIPSDDHSLAYINDNSRKSFVEIADLIEQHLERV